MSDTCLGTNSYSCDLNYGELPSDYSVVSVQLFKRGFHLSNLVDSKRPYFVRVSHKKGKFEQEYESEEKAIIAFSNICLKWHFFSIRYPGVKAVNPFDIEPILFGDDSIPFGFFKPIIRNDEELDNLGNYNIRNQTFNFAFGGFTNSDSELCQVIYRHTGKKIRDNDLENLLWIFTERTASLYKLKDSNRYVNGKFRKYKDYSTNNLELIFEHPNHKEALRIGYQIIGPYEFGQYELGFNW